MIEAQIKLNKAIRPKWKKEGHSDYLSTDAFLTQLVIELVELAADSGIEYKWWSKTPESELNSWNVKIEAIDMLHFYMSAMVVGFERTLEDGFDPSIYNEHFLGIDVMKLVDPELDTSTLPKMVKGNKLQYDNFMSILRDLIALDDYLNSTLPKEQIKQVVYLMLNSLICSVELSSIETSAIFTAKRELNQIRTSTGYKNGTYKKVKDGVEDNERLKPLVEEFLANEEMTLTQLAKNVRGAFFVVA